MRKKRYLIDLTNAERDPSTGYGGSDKKESIIYDEKRYMLKFPGANKAKNEYNSGSYINNVFSEYISSHIMQACGFDAHNTILAYYNDDLVVACENFIKPNESFLEFSWYERRQYNSSELDRVIIYNQLNEIFNNDYMLSTIKQTAITHYWEQYVMDALIGNFDRHSGNFGYIYNTVNKTFSCAPIYDCGSSLLPGLSENGMLDVLKNRKEFIKRMLIYPTSALKTGKNKIGYYDMLSSNFDQNCSKALLKVYPKIDMGKIEKTIEDAPNEISEVRKTFYKVFLRGRKELILDRAYQLIAEKKYDKESYDNIINDKQRKESQLDSIINDLTKDGWKYENLFTKEDIEILNKNGVEIKLDVKENDKDITLE